MKTRITTIVDNHALPGFSAEHGYSLLIEHNQRRILFDTGQSQAFIENFNRLNIAFASIEALILSHGHYDHTGNLDWLINNHSSAPVYYRQGITQKRFRQKEDGQMKPIGMPMSSAMAFAGLPIARKIQVEAALTVFPGIHLTGNVARINDFETTEKYFFLDEFAQFPDPIPDDQSIWLDTPTGIIIICGCCHAGLSNTIAHIINLSPGSRIRGIIGGMHLAAADENKILRTFAELRLVKPDFIIPAHCTGKAFSQYGENSPTRIITSAAGQVLNF
jgi:7,8-dihydropterin-6-yl-methyl-4-(beta-D-ribofuranosyl)aminobenzene 5'-phosphate synthase